jgi:integrase
MGRRREARVAEKRKTPGLKLRGKVWWIRYSRNGRRFEESAGTESKEAAKRLLDLRRGDVAKGLPISPKIGRLTFDDAAKAVVDDFKANRKRSLVVVERRINKHLQPYFGGRRMAAIGPDLVVEYVTKRQADVVVVRKARKETADDGSTVEVPAVTRPVSNGEINRELQILKRSFSLAVEQGRLLTKPVIKMLREDNVRTGFFEPDQLQAVLRHLPEHVRPVIRFAAVTGWRVPSEVLPLEWRNVDLKAGEVRLDPGTTKNGDGRVFPLTAELRAVLEAQDAERARLKLKGKVVPWVFPRVREVVDDKGKPELVVERIVSFHRAWRTACREAGCPGRIPHDLRRTAVRQLVRCGVPETVAMKLTGHKTRSVFERYDITSSNDLRAAARLLDGAAEARPLAR